MAADPGGRVEATQNKASQRALLGRREKGVPMEGQKCSVLSVQHGKGRPGASLHVGGGGMQMRKDRAGGAHRPALTLAETPNPTPPVLGPSGIRLLINVPGLRCSQESTEAKASSLPNRCHCAILTPRPAQPTLEWALK